jgi:hypothetical protein
VQDSTFVRTDAEMWQAVARAFECNLGTFEQLHCILVRGFELARRRATGVRRWANVLE